MNEAVKGRWMIFVASLLAILLLGILDTITGYEISFSIFYIGPIALASWYTNKETGRTVAICASIVWLLADLAAGQRFSHPIIPFWNALVRLVWFWVVASYLADTKEKLEQEKNPNRIDPVTGAYNAWAFYHRAERANQYCHSEQIALTVAYINCQLKDSPEYRARADAMLKLTHNESQWMYTIVQTILSRLHPSDTLARIAGGQFALVLPNTNSSAARLKLDTLMDCISDTILREHYPVQCRIAGVTFSPAPESFGEAIDKVDDVLLSMKNEPSGSIKHETITLQDSATGSDDAVTHNPLNGSASSHVHVTDHDAGPHN